MSLCGASANLDKLCVGLYGITGSSPRWAALQAVAMNGALAPRASYGLWDVVQQVQGDGGEWRYLVDLPVNLTSHLASFLLLAFWTPCGPWLNHIHSDSQPINIIIECLVLDLCISRALRILSRLDGL